MKLKDKFEEHESILESVYGSTPSTRGNTTGPLDIFTRLENDRKVKFPQFLYATITSRLAILQVVKYATIWTTFAIDVSSCPILVMPGSKMIELLPPLIDWHAWEDSRNWLQQEAENQHEPNKALRIFLCVFIFVRRSRLVEFVIKAFLNSVACCISFFPEYLDYFAPAMFCILALQGILYAGQVFVQLNRLLYPMSSRKGNQQPSSSARSDVSQTDVNVIEFTSIYRVHDDTILSSNQL
jgi:hypothetical protein